MFIIARHIILYSLFFLLVLQADARSADQEYTGNGSGPGPDLESTTYTVKKGENLYTIASQFGSSLFWEAIYIMNADRIRNPHWIYPGQELSIPYFVANYKSYGLPLRDVLHQPFCTTGDIAEIEWDAVTFDSLLFYDQRKMEPLSKMARAAIAMMKGEEEEMAAGQSGISEEADSADEAGDTEESGIAEAGDTAESGIAEAGDAEESAVADSGLTESGVAEEKGGGDEAIDDETLKAFREAFEELVREEEEYRRQQERQAATERRMFVEIDGMIHDETRSRIGRDFYDIFYASWQSPPEASHYSIRITEQPAPNLGTIVAVEVNNTVTYRNRLQPRHDIIEEAGRFAVRQTYMFLQQNQQQLIIY